MAVVTWEGAARGRGARLPHRGRRQRGAHRAAARSSTRKLEAALEGPRDRERSSPTRPSRSRRRGAASTSSSRPGPPAARRSPSTSRCWTRSRRSRSCARSTSTRPRRSPRTRRARSPSSASRACKPAIYDGDTEHERRWQIRKWANAILTNPDMLHVGVLPHHDRWADVLSNLRYVVVDEAHVYRGVFGSHVGNVLRRLRRAARIYGADPQFLLASATIANPGELAQLAARPRSDRHRATTRAPRAARTIAFWNPPLLDEPLQLRASALGEGARLLAELVSRGLRTICFAKSRKATELIHRFAAERLDAETAARLSPYRAGYTPAQRREIERRLVGGRAARRHRHRRARARHRHRPPRLRHLGGLPGHGGEPAAAVGPRRPAQRRPGGARRQRGRARPVLHARARGAPGAARRGGHPRPREPAHPRRPRALGRLRGAARRPRPRDARRRRARARGGADRRSGELRKTPAGIVWAGRDYPAGRVALRSASPESIAVIDAATGSVLGLVERERAFSTVHEGAVYLHLGESYRVLELDLDARAALVEAFTGRLLHPGEEGDDDRDRGGRARRRAGSGMEVSFGRVERHRAGDRLPAEVDPRPGDARARHARPPADDLRDRGDLVRALRRAARRARARCRSSSARSTPPSTP